ncbi:MAG: hypothetical protein QXH55_01880 [Candidatus Korarchaeota archaeon]|nr:hypothetical protein [Thermoproteota archaeon]MCR8462810.1 hypothetical protein [Thermoproteota archaeon]MCR8471365.1 hypothetical protein [Thermoproteota archaeon]MCR8472509.1 hypothetical protein [Thermoproteota archaeon]MCR8473631.1 hypothetical protein [Thermoproteota archaeon]
MSVQEREINKKLFFAGFAEFDEVEGPIISHILPESFPLDLETNYLIADSALYMNNKALFEAGSLIVYTYPFLIRHETLPRKAKKAAIVLAFDGRLGKETIVEILSKIEPHIESSVLELLSEVSLLTKHEIEKLVKKVYTAVKGVISSSHASQPHEYEGVEHRILGDTYFANNMVILDLGFNIIYPANRHVVNDFIKNPSDFIILKLSDKKYAIINKRIYDNVKQFLKT